MTASPTAKAIQKALRSQGDSAIAEHSKRFFKTGKGEYGEGDRFLGIRVPVLRQQIRTYQRISLEELHKLLASPFHEERLFALLMMVHQFKKGNEEQKAVIYQMYLDNTPRINNWDLVDSSAHHIVGVYLEDKDRQALYRLARSKDLWERRIAIIATLQFIRHHDFDDTLKISALLINDPEDLIHKAVGWMLREAGKRNHDVEVAFLKTHYQQMPRTMLRYAIEKFPEKERLRYLEGSA